MKGLIPNEACECKYGYYENDLCYKCHYSCNTCNNPNNCVDCDYANYRIIENINECKCKYTNNYYNDGTALCKCK